MKGRPANDLLTTQPATPDQTPIEDTTQTFEKRDDQPPGDKGRGDQPKDPSVEQPQDNKNRSPPTSSGESDDSVKEPEIT